MIKNQFGSSRMDTVLKMLLIAFVSLLAFSSGVYFGKQMSDNDYQLKALESDFNSQTKVAGNHDEQSPEDVINDEEVASLADKYVNAEKNEGRAVASTNSHGDSHGDNHAAPAKSASHGDSHAAPAKQAAHKNEDHGEQHEPVSQKPDLSAARRAAERVAHNASPVETPKKKAETRVPNSLPKTVGATGEVSFTVQVASYPTSQAAKEHADVLVKKGFPAFPVEATVNGRVWYRVSVGSFKTMKDATSYRATLIKQADVQSAIVQKITR